MIQPNELTLNLRVELANGATATTAQVWEILKASFEGNVEKVDQLRRQCYELIYAQYNYAPPIHFAVREGHTDLVKYLLEYGAHDPAYRFYPFQESLQTVAQDRSHTAIEQMLNEYDTTPTKHKFKGDNGRILYERREVENEFENAVDKNDLGTVRRMLHANLEIARDETYFWGEGILAMPAKENHRDMIELLLSYGAKVPAVLKWTQFYYFERYDSAAFMLQKGMSPDTMSWQRVTILHDMAQKGFIDKAKLLIEHGAQLNPIDDAYQSTPLGMAVRWQHPEMAAYLLSQGADPNRSGASWSTPMAWVEKNGNQEIKHLLRSAGAK
jgi:uncharacterized protein